MKENNGKKTLAKQLLAQVIRLEMDVRKTRPYIGIEGKEVARNFGICTINNAKWIMTGSGTWQQYLLAEKKIQPTDIIHVRAKVVNAKDNSKPQERVQIIMPLKVLQDNKNAICIFIRNDDYRYENAFLALVESAAKADVETHHTIPVEQLLSSEEKYRERNRLIREASQEIKQEAQDAKAKASEGSSELPDLVRRIEELGWEVSLKLKKAK